MTADSVLRRTKEDVLTDLPPKTIRDAYLEFGAADRAGADLLTVTTDAVVPEVPQGARLLIDKKARTYAAGDIVQGLGGWQEYCAGDATGWTKLPRIPGVPLA